MYQELRLWSLWTPELAKVGSKVAGQTGDYMKNSSSKWRWEALKLHPGSHNCASEISELSLYVQYNKSIFQWCFWSPSNIVATKLGMEEW
jgi:hypothetical protein